MSDFLLLFPRRLADSGSNLLITSFSPPPMAGEKKRFQLFWDTTGSRGRDRTNKFAFFNYNQEVF
ncbi:MAG: hypothetical protein LBR79_00590 [Oscillospiraceae bacterium]|nr:hypothetical protein [Oscillospiraceae bacterium]